MKKCLCNPIFETVSKVASSLEVSAYVVGGFVRDCIIERNKDNKDIDIVVIGDGIGFAREVAKKINPKIKVSIFKNFGTAMFRYKGVDIEFVGARKESYQRDSRKPKVLSGTLEDDQKRRDFTINAMAISLNKESYGSLLDPFHGIEDLQNRTIITPLEPDTTFSDDPLRMMRAIRFACQLDFSINAETFQSITRNASRIIIVSPERVIVELNKILLSEKPSIGLQLLHKSTLLQHFFPELDALKGIEVRNKMAHKDNFDHTIQVVDNVSKLTDKLYLRWAALLHDIAKPITKKYTEDIGWSFHGHEYIGSKMIPKIFKRLRMPLNENMKYVQKLVNLHLRPITLSQEEVTDSALRRLLFEAGDDIDDLMLLCEADITSKNEKKVKLHLENFSLVRKKLKETEERDQVRNFQAPISGDEIMDAFGVDPCKKVGIIKDFIKESILEGDIPNTPEAARVLMYKKGIELGLKRKI